MKIYLSGTSDMANITEKLLKKLSNNEISTKYYKENFTINSGDSIYITLESLNKADKFVLLLGKDYGPIIQDLGKSIIHYEFDVAYKKNIPIMIFMKKDLYLKFKGLSKNTKERKKSKKDSKMLEFLEEIKERKIWVSTGDNVDSIYKEIIRNWFTNKKVNIFISVSSKDIERFQIDYISKELRKFPEIGRVSNPNDVKDSNQNIINYMNNEIGDSDLFLLFCSESSQKSAYIETEWHLAYSINKIIIPVFTDLSHIPILLTPRQGIKFNPNDIDGFISKFHDFLKVSRPKEKKREKTPIQKFIDEINWHILEKNDIMNKERFLSLRDSIKRGLSKPENMILMGNFVGRFIEFIYQQKDIKYGDSSLRELKLSKRIKLKILKDKGYIPQNIAQSMDSIFLTRNLIAHNDLDDTSFKNAVPQFYEVFQWFYSELLRHNIKVEPDIERKTAQKSIYWLKEINIENLFGLYDYSINLENEERISIIYGPNGSGKTTILEMIYNLSKGKIKEILDKEFTVIKFIFEHRTTKNKSVIIINKEKESIDIETHNRISKLSFHSFEPVFIDFLFETYFAIFKDEKITIKKAKFLNKVKNFYPENFKHIKSDYAFFESFFTTIHNFDCVYIPALRLEITMQELFRFLNKINDITNALTYKTIEEMKRELLDNVIVYKLKKFTNEYLKYSFREEYKEKSLNPEIIKKLDNFKKKLSLFQNLIENVFVNKEIEPHLKEGFIAINEKGKEISLKQLSSGEKNLLIMIYDCIFGIREDTLLLIDEPEISLHIVWQLQFLDILDRIKQMREFDVLISTHSPQIVHNRRDLCITLYEGENKNNV
ncbi:MAG: DUF4062 domain-containing protein [Promethearchaeota archaeon]|nr:MAG: DUF4062 domain-containing protein [Candidatus Lokiarchaeota archaeon]